MTYYKERKNKQPIDYEAYWENPVDTDGNNRDRLKERDKYIRNNRTEIEYVKENCKGRIVDIGCGLGYFLSALPNSFEKHGVELSEYASKEARKYGEIRKTLYYPRHYFDTVVSMHVIEHIEKPENFIKQIRKILRDNGMLIIGTPDFDSGCARRFGENYRLLHDDTHISLFTNESMFRFLRDNGFRIFKVDYPFFDTEYFTEENLLKMFDTDKISPPFYGNFMTFYCTKEDLGLVK